MIDSKSVSKESVNDLIIDLYYIIIFSILRIKKSRYDDPLQ